MQKSNKMILKTTSLIVGATFLSKLLGLLREILLTASYGTGIDAQAYEAASRLPTVLFDFALGGVVTAAFIPVFNEIIVREGKENALKYASKYMNLIILVTVGVTALGLLFGSQMISLLAPGLEETTKALATSLSAVMFPMIIFTGIAYCLVGILQSFGEFNIPAIISLVSNAVMVLYFYTLNNRFGIYGLAVAMLVGWCLQAAVQIPKAHGFGFRFRPTLNIASPHITQSIKLAFPILVCSWLSPVINIINTRFASYYEGGRALTAVSYANRFYIIIVGIFSFVVTNLLFPKLSRKVAEGNQKQAYAFAGTSIKILLFIMIPAALGLFILAEPLTQIIYMRGEFTMSDVLLTAPVLKYFALGMPFMAASEVITKLYFSKQRVIRPMLVSLASIALNMALVYALTNTLGIIGIALASSISIAFCAILNYALVLGGEILLSKKDFADLLKIIVAAILMGAAVYLFYNNIGISSYILKTALSIAIGIAVYAVVSFLLPISEIKSLFQSKRKEN